MKRKLLLFGFFSLITWNISNCAINIPDTSSSGYIFTSVKFPTGKFSIKVIPDETRIILVTVSGTGLDANKPITFDLSKDETTRVIGKVPEGDKLVRVKALDANNELVAEGQNTVNIIANKVNRVEITLNKVTKTVPTNILPTSTPSEAPKPSPCVIRIKPEDAINLTDGLKASIKEAGCDFVLPTKPRVNEDPEEKPTTSPTPSNSITPSPSSTPNTNSSGGNSSLGTVSSDIKANVSVVDAPPLPDTIDVITAP